MRINGVKMNNEMKSRLRKSKARGISVCQKTTLVIIKLEVDQDIDK